MAPVVDFQGGVGQRHSLNPCTKGIRIYRSEIVQGFVVHAQGENKVAEFTLGDIPGHIFTHLHGLPDILFPVFPRVLEIIRKGHILVQPVNISVCRAFARNKGRYQGKD
jgi:hypothetical protein